MCRKDSPNLCHYIIAREARATKRMQEKILAIHQNTSTLSYISASRPENNQLIGKTSLSESELSLALLPSTPTNQRKNKVRHSYKGGVFVPVVVLLGGQHQGGHGQAQNPHAGRHLFPLGHLLCFGTHTTRRVRKKLPEKGGKLVAWIIGWSRVLSISACRNIGEKPDFLSGAIWRRGCCPDCLRKFWLG